MNFEFPDENIMLVTDYETPGLDEGPEEESRWSMYFDGASNALGNGIGAVIISPKGSHTPFTARLCFNSPTIWRSMKRASWVFEQQLT